MTILQNLKGNSAMKSQGYSVGLKMTDKMVIKLVIKVKNNDLLY